MSRPVTARLSLACWPATSANKSIWLTEFYKGFREGAERSVPSFCYFKGVWGPSGCPSPASGRFQLVEAGGAEVPRWVAAKKKSLLVRRLLCQSWKSSGRYWEVRKVGATCGSRCKGSYWYFLQASPWGFWRRAHTTSPFCPLLCWQ